MHGKSLGLWAQLDGTPMSLDDQLRYGESQARSTCMPRNSHTVEPFEHLSNLLLRNANAVVLNHYVERLGGSRCSEVDMHSIRIVGDCIVDEDDEKLTEPVGVEIHAADMRGAGSERIRRGRR